MGWFSSKKKTYVSTEVTRLYKDKDIPDMHQKNVIDSVLKDKRLTNTIINNALNSQTLKLERAYRKAARGDYYYGAPNHNIRNAADGKDVLQNILGIEHNAPVTLAYFHFAPLNNLHYAWQQLVNDYGYDEFSNTLTMNGVSYWVHDVVGQINTQAITSDATAEEEQELLPDEGTLDNWDRHPQDRYTPFRTGAEKTPIWLFGEDVPDGAEVTLVDAAGEATTLFIDTIGFDRDLECFQAKYHYTVDGQRNLGYFTYEYNHGEYPSLDAVHNKTAVGKGTFFPLFLFRANGRNLTASSQHDTEAYKSSVRLARSVGLDYQYLGDMVNENESADDLDQAVLMMGVPAKTSDPDEAEYLFRFFDWLYKESGRTSAPAGTGLFNTTRPGKSIQISERDFDCTLSFSSINRRYKSGVIGEVGSYTCQEITLTKYRTLSRRVSRAVDGDVVYTTEHFQIPYEVSGLEYRYQVNAGNYQSLLVDSLKLRYNIYGSKGVDANVGNSKLLVPLDYFITRSMRYAKKDRLYYRSLHFVFNARVTETVKWYQRGAFQIVLVIVAVVVSFLIAGSDGGSLIGAALSAGAYGAAAMLMLTALIEAVIINMVVQEAITFVIKELGAEFGAVLAVVAFVAAIYGANTGASWSSSAIQASNNLASASMSQYQKDQMAEYNAEQQAFDLLKSEQLEDLEEAENLLQQYPLLDARSFIAKEPVIMPGETPDSLYERTVHVGNPGILQYDYIESYVALNTRLPTFNELVGDTFYGRI